MHRFVVTALMACLALIISRSAMAQGDYLLAAGDTIEISVLEDPSLNRQALIRPDGKISLPLAGTLAAAGKTTDELQRLIRSRLGRDFVDPPTVTVSLVGLSAQSASQETGLATVYVLGEVGAPGRYDVALPMDVLQLLAMSGGPRVFAARDRMQIRRTNRDGGEEVMVFDYDAVERGAAPINRIQIGDGDVLVVPERGLFE